MEWIPVSEQLPELNQYGQSKTILCYSTDRMAPFAGWYDEEEDVWIANVCGEAIQNITHWMPLPDPPQPDQAATVFDPSIKPTT